VSRDDNKITADCERYVFEEQYVTDHVTFMLVESKSKGHVTRCNFSCNLQCNSTLERR
jgi:hypothetical protein